MNNTLTKGLGLLESIAKSDHPMGVTELSRLHGINKSNVHRVLQSLVALRYVRHDKENGLYSPSIRLWGLGSAALQTFDLKRVALPYMEDVLDKTHETVHISVLDGMEVVYVHKLDSPEPIRSYSQIGGRYPAHCVATGKAMLAYLCDSELQVLSRDLRPSSPNSIVEPSLFMAEMKKTRKRHYAINRGECSESVWGVAAPIWGAKGEVIAAIGLSGPAARVKAANANRLGACLLDAAYEISMTLSGIRELDRTLDPFGQSAHRPQQRVTVSN